MELNFVSFICRGLANPLKLTSLVSNLNHKQDLIEVQETKIIHLPRTLLTNLQNYDASCYTQLCSKNRSACLITAFTRSLNSQLIFQKENLQLIHTENEKAASRENKKAA